MYLLYGSQSKKENGRAREKNENKKIKENKEKGRWLWERSERVGDGESICLCMADCFANS